jgi:hypothetical protein
MMLDHVRLIFENASSLSSLFIYAFREEMISKHGLNRVPRDFRLTNVGISSHERPKLAVLGKKRERDKA